MKFELSRLFERLAAVFAPRPAEDRYKCATLPDLVSALSRKSLDCGFHEISHKTFLKKCEQPADETCIRYYTGQWLSKIVENLLWHKQRFMHDSYLKKIERDLKEQGSDYFQKDRDIKNMDLGTFAVWKRRYGGWIIVWRICYSLPPAITFTSDPTFHNIQAWRYSILVMRIRKF